MHIVYATYDITGISGGHRVIIEHVNRLAALGHKVEIWNYKGTAESYFASKVPIVAYSSGDPRVADVVVMTDPVFLGAVLRLRKKQKTYLLLQHDTEWIDEVTGYATERSIFTEYDGQFADGSCPILAVSHWLEATLRQKYNVRSIVIENGIDDALFYPAIPALQFDDPIALLFYDAQAWKGFDTAIDALHRAQAMTPNLKVVVVGPYFFHFPKTELPVSFRLPMVFINKPKQSELAAIYSSATVFVGTSVKEGFGLPGLEAMACGVPVVTTDAGGNMDYAKDGYNALIVPPGKSDEIARNIKRIIDEPKLRERLKVNGRKTAEKFSWDASIRKLEQTFMGAG